MFNCTIKTTKKMLGKTVSFFKKHYSISVGWLLLLVNGLAFASDNNPFPDMDISGDVINTGGQYLERTLKYALIGGGGLLILISLAVLVNRLRDDSKEKDHGNLITTFILVALGVTFGFVLIATGWKAFNATIS
jgi:hypothetical protein